MPIMPFYIDDGVKFGRPHLVGSHIFGESYQGHVYTMGETALVYSDGSEYAERFKHQPITEDMIGYGLFETNHDVIWVSSISVLAYGQEITLPVRIFFNDKDTDKSLRKRFYKKLSDSLNKPGNTWANMEG